MNDGGRRRLGSVVLGLLALGVVALVGWGLVRRSSRKRVQVAIYLGESTQGLAVGSPVRLRGITLGEVRSIRIASDGRLIEVESALWWDRLVELGLADPAQPFTPLADDELDLSPTNAPLDFAREGLIHLVHPQRCTLHQSFRECGTDATSQVIYFRNVTREVELDRMKSDFLATAAHELRTPMASIMGFSELLMMRSYSAEKTRELLGTINTQAQRLTGLLNDLLDLARIEARRARSFQFETLPAGPLLEEHT